MEHDATGTYETQHSPLARRWQPIAIALLLVLITHQLLMVTPLTMAMSTMDSTSQDVKSETPCGGECPTGIVSLCIPGRICAGVEAALTRLPFTPVLRLALLIVTVLAIRTSILAFRRERWLWPPDRRRALLQVFLI